MQEDPTRTLQPLADLPAALHRLAPRHGLPPPQALWLAITTARHGSAAQVASLLTLPAALGNALQGAGADWPHYESPSEHLDRALRCLLSRLRGHHPEAVPALPPGAAGQRLAWQSQWLMDAADRAVLEGAEPPGPIAPSVSDVDHCRLHALLVDGDGSTQHGQVAQITLYRVHQPGAHLQLVAAPSSALTPCSVSFLQALSEVTALLRQHLTAAEAFDTALAWDIAPVGGVLWGLDGPSAGAAFAVGALWLLRRELPVGHRWRQALARLQRPDLMDAHITAQLLPDGGLRPVAGEQLKAEALQAFAAARKTSIKVYVAPDDGLLRLPALRAGCVFSAQPTLDRLITTLAAHSRQRLSASQELLLGALLQRDPQHQHPPQLPLDVLIAVADGDPVITLVQYALQRWAHWGRQQGGQWQNRFVPLDMVAAHDAGLPANLAPRPGGYGSLLQLLRENQHLRLHAYLLRGQPGAGKTTLLQHHEQAICRQALQDWEDGLGMAELPLYVPLSGLPAEGSNAEPMAWLREQFTLAPRYRHCTELHALFNASPGQPAVPGQHPDQPRLRALLDGLNELPVPAHGSRNQRAHELLFSVVGHLPGVPVLLGSRTHHSFDFTQAQPELHVAPVDVQPWGEAAVQGYISRRFADAAVADGHWQALRQQPHVLQLCQTPFNLAGQCDLWQAGHGRLITDRADLYSRLLWQALVRELTALGGLPVNPLLHDPELLTKADRQALQNPDALRGDSLPPWPTEGVLLRGLFRQALAQWWQAADTRPDLPASQRGEVEVPWDDEADEDGDHPEKQRRSVVHWLQPDLRVRWREAVRSLNLLDDFQPEAHRGRPDGSKLRAAFKFRHQSWGEYLASVALLPARPDKMDDADRQRLHRVLAAPRVQRPSAEEELAHQRQQVRQRWQQLDPALQQSWLTDGITLGRQAVWDRMLDDFGGNRNTLQAVWDQFCRHGLLEDVPPHVDVTARLDRWAIAIGVPQSLNLPSDAWQDSPEAWQMLVVDKLWPPFADEIWRQVGDAQARQLQAQSGRLQLPAMGDLDEVLGLALLGQAQPDRPMAWLQDLVVAGHWQALAPVLPALARRLEPQGAWPLPGQPAPHPVLQHLRRLLLVYSVDAGANVQQRVRASGLWQVLPDTIDGLPPALQAHWQQVVAQAFGGPGRDLRLRLQAGLALGELGDNLRFQQRWAPGADGQPWPGLRLHPRLWATLPPGSYRLGSDVADPQADGSETPLFEPRLLQAFDMARLPVTVGEWRRFVAAGGYEPMAPWWRTAAPDSVGDVVADLATESPAQAWLRQRGATLGPRQAVRPTGWNDPHFNNPLQPVVGITWFEAVAYARWAAALYADLQADEQQAGGPRLQLQLPTEGLWEAGVRGPVLSEAAQLRWPHATGEDGPSALDFNHANSRWGQPSPVGVFSRGLTALGLADTAGNVWEWCSNLLSQDQRSAGYRDEAARLAALLPADALDANSFRALRGGACYSTADGCRVAYRDHDQPDDGGSYIGLRLVRCELPHSGHWTLDTGP